MAHVIMAYVIMAYIVSWLMQFMTYVARAKPSTREILSWEFRSNEIPSLIRAGVWFRGIFFPARLVRVCGCRWTPPSLFFEMGKVGRMPKGRKNSRAANDSQREFLFAVDFF